MTTPGPGGYRRPASPAPVSGPAQLSRRTDGGPGQAVKNMPDAKYGENRDYVAQQQGAPLAKAAGPPAPSSVPVPGPRQTPAQPDNSGAQQQLPEITGFSAPSARPNEPVTAGSPLGPGPGPIQDAVDVAPAQLSSALERYVAGDDTGYLRLLINDLAEWGI